MAPAPLAAMLWPETVAIQDGRLHIGGCDTVALAAEHGTPLYVFDEATLRGAMRGYGAAFAATGLDARVHYASKALLNTAVAQLVAQDPWVRKERLVAAVGMNVRAADADAVDAN